ncbi:unnamed protein product [Caretta caretta]
MLRSGSVHSGSSLSRVPALPPPFLSPAARLLHRVGFQSLWRRLLLGRSEESFRCRRPPENDTEREASGPGFQASPAAGAGPAPLGQRRPCSSGESDKRHPDAQPPAETLSGTDPSPFGRAAGDLREIPP